MSHLVYITLLGETDGVTLSRYMGRKVGRHVIGHFQLFIGYESGRYYCEAMGMNEPEDRQTCGRINRRTDDNMDETLIGSVYAR